MDLLRRISIIVVIATCILLQTQGADKYTDEKRPYEFGFSIDGQQHRHEKKDKNGIIMGEFGFITADNVYHVTVYATDENGRFKIISMKNIHLKSESTSSRQGHALQLTNTQNAVTSTPTTTQKPETTFKPISIEPPVNSCSHCSVPTTSTAAPVAPVPIPASGTPFNNVGLTGPASNSQNNQVPSNIGLNNGSPQYSQIPGAGPGQPLSSQNIFSNNNQLTPEIQNRNAFQDDVRGPSTSGNFSPLSNSGVSNQQGVNLSPNSGASPQFPSVNAFNAPQNSPGFGNAQSSQGIINNQQSNTPYQPSSGQPRTIDQHNNNAFANAGDNNPINTDQTPGAAGPRSPKLYSGTLGNGPNANTLTPGQQYTPQTGQVSGRNELDGNQPNNNYNNQNNPGGSQPDYNNQNGPNGSQPNNEKPTLAYAQMQIVDKNTDIHSKRPGEKEGLPKGLTENDMVHLLYTFNYTLGFQAHFEEGYSNGVKQGYYYVTGRNGIRTRIDYIADDKGFRPKISQEVLDLVSDDVPKPETEKEEKYGLKGYEFKWLYYPLENKQR